MEPIEIFYLLFLNALPVICLAIPIPFIYKRVIGKLYFRIFLGIVIFFLVYWILPIIFQIGIDPKELQPIPEDPANLSLGFQFIFTHMISLIGYFFQYPFVTLTFIFIVGPMFSLILLWRKLSKEPGTMSEKLSELTYELKKSPSDMIKEGLRKGGWSEEKELFKLLIVLLPISLYLLSVLIDLLGLETFSLVTGETTMGLFVEILFVYLATLLFGIHLVYSSKISFQGRYIGEKLRENTFRSLYQVGIPISLLSILLFLAKPTTNPIFIFYFFAYFLMGAGIFILFLKIFEPLSILLLIRFIDWWKFAKKKFSEIDWTNFHIPLIFGLAVSFGILLIYFLLTPLWNMISAGNVELLIDKAAITYIGDIYLEDALRIDQLNIFNTLVSIFSIIIMAIIFSKCLQYIKRITNVSFIYLGSIICVSIFIIIFSGGLQSPPINFLPEEYWITGSPALFSLFGGNFYTIRTVLFDVNLSSPVGIPLLEVLAFPYIYTRYIFNILMWGIIFYYLDKVFITKNIPQEDDIIERVAFSRISEFPKYEDYLIDRYRYLVTKTAEFEKGAEEREEREEVTTLMDKIKKDKFLKDLKPTDTEEIRRFYYTLKYLFYNRVISIWIPEFSYEYKKADLQGLYVIYSDGRDIFNYNFKEVDYADPALISGMFSAITSFIKEATKSSELLRTIDHGDITILLEYGKHVFSALFVKGKQTLENRSLLKEFVEWFEEKHGTRLKDWTGALLPFREASKDVERIFKGEEE